MRLYPGRTWKLESAIGILILFVLAVIAAGVYRHSLLDKNEAPISTSNSQRSTFNVERSTFDVYQMMPVGEAETYGNDTLYEKINGKAPMYQEAGFVKLTTQRFSGAKNADLGFERYLFDMGNSKNAFSVYSRQKRTDVVDLNDFQFGYQTTNGVYFSYGRHYVEMVGFAESQELLDAMKDIAKKLIAGLPVGEKDRIKELAMFPPGTIAGSRQLQLKDAFGFDGLTDTYSAKYKVDGKTVTIFFSERNNTDDARTVAKNYTDFLVANGAKIVDAGVLDFFGGTEIVFSAGPFVAGVHEADDRDSALKAANVLREHLNNSN